MDKVLDIVVHSLKDSGKKGDPCVLRGDKKKPLGNRNCPASSVHVMAAVAAGIKDNQRRRRGVSTQRYRARAINLNDNIASFSMQAWAYLQGFCLPEHSMEGAVAVGIYLMLFLSYLFYLSIFIDFMLLGDKLLMICCMNKIFLGALTQCGKR
jgi:hypothetical protein